MAEIMLWKEEISRVRDAQMNNLRGMLGIMRMDRVLKARIKELSGVKKDLDKGLRKVCSGGVAIWRGILLRESM